MARVTPQAPPGQVKLGGQTWTVVIVDKLKLAGAWVYGRCFIRHCQIRLNAAQSAEQMRDTVLHEVLHAALNNVSITLEDEEALVQALTPWLLMALRDNPDLVTYLTA